MIIFAANDPLVLNGTYDREGYKPGERARIAKARARQSQEEEIPMAKTTKRRQARKMDRKRTKPTKPTAKPARSRPRQPDLPGTEDRAIRPLENIAASYADVRDRRIELNREESELKQTALKLMKQFGKMIYRRDGIEIRIVPGEDDVKVKIRKPGDDDVVESNDATGDSVEIMAAAAEAVEQAADEQATEGR